MQQHLNSTPIGFYCSHLDDIISSEEEDPGAEGGDEYEGDRESDSEFDEDDPLAGLLSDEDEDPKPKPKPRKSTASQSTGSSALSSQGLKGTVNRLFNF